MIASHRKSAEGSQIVMKCQSDLLEIISALSPPCGFTRHLHGRKKKCNKNSNNCNHHQQFDQCERATSSAHTQPPSNRGMTGKMNRMKRRMVPGPPCPGSADRFIA